MNEEMLLTPEELYFLGTFLNAKYIDYAYIAALDDFGKSYAVFENDKKSALVRSGVLNEDFSGTVEINEAAASLLKPVFFGEAETSLDVSRFDDKAIDVYKFHFYDGLITMVSNHQGTLKIKHVSHAEIKDLLSRFMPAVCDCDGMDKNPEIDETKITRLFSVRSIIVGKASVVKTYIEADRTLYYEEDTGTVCSIPWRQFAADAYAVLKGV